MGSKNHIMSRIKEVMEIKGAIEIPITDIKNIQTQIALAENL